MNSYEIERHEHRFLIAFTWSNASIVDLTVAEQQQMLDILADRKPQSFSTTIRSVTAGGATEVWLIDSFKTRDQLIEQFVTDPDLFKQQVRNTGDLMWGQSVNLTERKEKC